MLLLFFRKRVIYREDYYDNSPLRFTRIISNKTYLTNKDIKATISTTKATSFSHKSNHRDAFLLKRTIYIFCCSYSIFDNNVDNSNNNNNIQLQLLKTYC